MQIELFDLNLLRALDLLLQERNVTRAAQRMHVTQQAMSGSLRRLRLFFEDELLVRVGRSMEPTPLAAALREQVRELIRGIEATLHAQPAFDPQTSRRRFRIAMSDYATLALLPALMAHLSRTAPNIVCDVELIQPGLFRDLEEGTLDFCVLPSNWRLFQENRPEGVRSLPLYGDDFVCVVDRDNPAFGDSITRDQYLAASHNSLRLGSGVRSIIEEAWLLARVSPRVAATTTSFASLIWMVPGTRLIATAQRRLAQRFSLILPIKILECPIPVEALRAELHWNLRSDADLAHRFMRDAFVTAAAAIDDDTSGSCS